MNLKNIRQKLKLSQTKMAHILGITQVAISNYENKLRDLNLSKIKLYQEKIIKYCVNNNIEISNLELTTNISKTNNHLIDTIVNKLQIDPKNLITFSIHNNINNYYAGDILIADLSDKTIILKGNYLININGTNIPAQIKRKNQELLATADGGEININENMIIAKIKGKIIPQ